MLKSIQFPPGINKDTTEYGAEPSWVDCDKIRFKKDRAEKIGGWEKDSAFNNRNNLDNLSEEKQFTGVARTAHSWSSLSSERFLAVGTHLKLELLSGGVIFDITPVRETKVFNNVLTTEENSNFVTIQDTDTNHGFVVGDYLDVISQENVVGGNVTLQGQYQVSEVVDLNTFKVGLKNNQTAQQQEENGGGEIEIHYLIENGSQNNGDITGYSGGTYDTPGQDDGGWNEPRIGVGGVFLRQWSLDNWGEDLVACIQGKGIYLWDKTTGEGTRAKRIENSPSRNSFVMVAQPSRFLVSFGSEEVFSGEYDPLLVRWASQETLNEWEQTEDNTAGEYRLPLGNKIVTAVQTRSEIIIMTDSAVYSMRFVGGSQIFRFDVLSPNSGAASLHCGVDVNGIVFWASDANFFMYDGSVRNLTSTISKYMFDQDGLGKINFNQKEKLHCSLNKEFNEVWWFYQKEGFGIEDNDSYVVFNYKDNLWYIGEMERTCWVDRSVFDKPYAIDTNGFLYVHEQGKDADGAPLEAYIKSSFFDIGDGEQFLFVDKIIPDAKLPANKSCNINLYFSKYPNGKEQIKGPYTFQGTTSKISCRGRGRQMAIEFKVVSTGSDFEIGKTRINLIEDGGR